MKNRKIKSKRCLAGKSLQNHCRPIKKGFFIGLAVATGRRCNMSVYVHFTDEQKQRANNVDLVAFLEMKGEN